jgi:hypothetical protein
MSAGRGVLIALILASTVVFVAAVTLERHETTRVGASETAAQRAAEQSESGEGERSHDNAEQSESSEKLLGVNPESTGLLAVAVVVSLLFALAVWRAGSSPLLLGVVALAMAAFCALDVREVVHQLNESRAGLAVLAGLVACLHLAAAVLAARAALVARDQGPPLSGPAHA